MSKKDNSLASLASLLLVVGAVLLLAVDSSNMFVLVAVKIAGLMLTISGSYMMGEQDGEQEND